MAEKIKPANQLSSISVKLGNKILLVRLNEIVFFEADEKYVTIKTFEKEYIIDICLKSLEERLPENFIRVQRAFIINRNYIIELNKHFMGRFIIVMNDKNHTRIVTGNSYREKIITYLDL
ncbi:MAG: LytTR family transcriptional regulator [Bacteroidales bacterium]|nr:LytTR family transcriptional regulator [Bacteroidales bacterium]